MPKVSIVIPCYNGQDTIIRCCKSLINQSINYEVEIIVVNDGSMDDTQTVLEKFIKENSISNIILINTRNHGVSAARNIGIEISQGEYIGFVDADDYVSSDMYSDMLDVIEKDDITDLVISDFFYGELDSNNLSLSASDMTTTLNREQVTRAIFHQFKYQGFVCNKLYKKSIIDRYQIRFDKELTLMEDLDFNLNYLQYIKKSVFIDRKYYYYCLNTEGVMFSGLNDSKVSFIKKYKKLLKYELVNITDLVETHFTIFLLQLLSTYYQTDVSDKKIENEIIREIKKRKNVFLKYGLNYEKKYYLGYIMLLFSKRIFKIGLKKSKR